MASSSKLAASDQLPDYGGVMEAPNLIFEDRMTVLDVDHKRFDRVGRVSATGIEGNPRLFTDNFCLIRRY